MLNIKIIILNIANIFVNLDQNLNNLIIFNYKNQIYYIYEQSLFISNIILK